MHLLRNRLSTGMVLATMACTGCASTPTHENLTAFLKAHEHAVAAVETRVDAGDTIRITAPRAFEIDHQTRSVQPDGKIALRLVGEVRVAGLTAREIATKLEELLTPYYNDPDVDVQVVDQPRRGYYVLGQVSGAGLFRFTGRDTVLHALAVARPNTIAWQSRIKVIRPSPVEGDRRELRIDIQKMIKTGDTRMNILLEPGDIVYVPPTPLGWLGLKVREALFPVSPVLNAYSTPARFMSVQNTYERGVAGGTFVE